MKKIFLILFWFSGLAAQSQPKYQIGMGAGRYFLQSVNMKTGTMGLKFRADRNVFIDYNRIVNKKHSIGLGAQFAMNLTSYVYEPDQAIPYYSEKPHIKLFEFESAELYAYVKKSFKVLVSKNDMIRLFVNLGPCFNINEGNFIIMRHGVRDDNDQYFQISHIRESAQKLFVPYLRISSGLEIMKKFKKGYYFGISPFVSWVGLQSENNELTVLRDDPAYISTGDFKRTRSGYGVRLIFQNR